MVFILHFVYDSSMKWGIFMRLTFSGAAHEVTGSCHYLEACGHKMFIDYGMEQGEDFFENQPVSAAAAEID